MREITSAWRERLPTLLPLLAAALLGPLLLFLAGCGASQPQPITVPRVEVLRLSPPASLLAPACPAEPVAPDLSGPDWETSTIDWLTALLERGACLDGALEAIRRWVVE